MKQKQLMQDIQYIKDVIHSSLHYTNLSGIAAILSGIVAIIGCGCSYFIMQQHAVQSISWELVAIWTLVFLASVIANVYFICRKARKTGEPAWSRLARLIIYALSPSFLVGASFTLFLAYEGHALWIPGFWMVTYGLGVWSAGLFSIPEPRWLGAAFMITGLITLFFFVEYSLIMLAISFGCYHIIYGIRLFLRYGEG